MTWFTRTHRPVYLRFRTTVVAGALSCAMLAAASPAVAQDDWRRVELSGGGLLATFDTTVRLDDPLGLDGTSIDFEDDLGLDSGTGTWFVQGLWRISRRNQLTVSYQNFSRDVSRTVLDRDIVFGDETFTVGAEVSAFIDARYLTVDYGFAFVATPTVEFGASVGVNAVRLETGLDLSASVAGGASTLA